MSNRKQRDQNRKNAARLTALVCRQNRCCECGETATHRVPSQIQAAFAHYCCYCYVGSGRYPIHNCWGCSDAIRLGCGIVYKREPEVSVTVHEPTEAEKAARIMRVDAECQP